MVSLLARRIRRTRKQYYFRPSERGLLAWDVDRLVMRTKQFPRIQIPLTSIRELDEAFGSEHEGALTWRGVIEHVRLIQEADLSFAIILSADGRVMDGMHRVAKAVLLGRATIEAVQFANDPEPDYVGRSPDELSYDEAPTDRGKSGQELKSRRPQAIRRRSL